MSEILKINEKLFCEYYATSVVGTRGNATQSYVQAYPDKNPTLDTAGVEGWRMLRKPKIINELKRLWKLSHLTDEEVDSELAGIVRQDKDMSNKLGAIREYNRVQGRASDKLKVEVDLTDELRKPKTEN